MKTEELLFRFLKSKVLVETLTSNYYNGSYSRSARRSAERAGDLYIIGRSIDVINDKSAAGYDFLLKQYQESPDMQRTREYVQLTHAAAFDNGAVKITFHLLTHYFESVVGEANYYFDYTYLIALGRSGCSFQVVDSSTRMEKQPNLNDSNKGFFTRGVMQDASCDLSSGG